MDREWFEDFTEGEISRSPGRTITESDIHAFAALTGDWHPLHTDVTYAEKTPFRGRIAHGMLVLSVGMALGLRLGQYHTLPKSFIAFYGMEDVRFTAPVKLGDTIHLESETVKLEPKDAKRGIVTSRGRIKNQNGADVCVFTTKFLCGRKPQ
jgi:3-hydroxybutyryl-CoA dehydratase